MVVGKAILWYKHWILRRTTNNFFLRKRNVRMVVESSTSLELKIIRKAVRRCTQIPFGKVLWQHILAIRAVIRYVSVLNSVTLRSLTAVCVPVLQSEFCSHEQSLKISYIIFASFVSFLLRHIFAFGKHTVFDLQLRRVQLYLLPAR